MKSAQIPLYGRSGEIKAWALVDQSHFEWLSESRWHLTSGGYAARCATRLEKRLNSYGSKVYMHRAILGLSNWNGKGIEVDHINRDKLDNRKRNLRRADRCLQNQNKEAARYHFDKWSGKWRVEITVNKVKFRLGRYDTEDEAQDAVDAYFALAYPND